MTHRFPIKEIARQAGLGPATIDRVLNNRANVSPQTRNRVAAALREFFTARHDALLTTIRNQAKLDAAIEADLKKACDTWKSSLA